MRKFIGILTILGLLTALCAARGSFAQTSSTQILLERARNLENHGHLDLAARVWKQVLLSDPDTVEALDWARSLRGTTGERDRSKDVFGQGESDRSGGNRHTSFLAIASVYRRFDNFDS